ncbi:MAG: ribulokinase [Eubacterium sp.]|nr:ribulokinase [Eubacterium sp.]
MAKYIIGVDYGTLSGRAIIADVETGRELPKVCDYNYPHAVMKTELPGGKKLPVDYALQDPQDYLEALSNIVPDVMKENGVSPEDVIAIGVDFTACSVLPVDKEGTPLCFLGKYREDPMAYVQLWQHHGAQEEANEITRLAEERGEKFLARLGGKVSSESLIPRIWKIAKDDPELYHDMDEYLEAGDWIVEQLTGSRYRNSCDAGCKSLWHAQEGFPSKDFFRALDPRLENVVEEKLHSPIRPIGFKAGEITEKGARLTGLKVGTAVSVAIADGHASVAGTLEEAEEGQMVMIMGTSCAHFLVGTEDKIVPGCFSVAKDSVLPGFYGYECGQSGFGDHYAWFVNHCVPEEYSQMARAKGMDIHQYLTEKCAALNPGESGLLALDWWNGNRSVLNDSDLTGLIVGMRLTTRPEEVYRALIEATAYGTRKIVDTFEESGVPVEKIYATGGISQKNPVAMQIFADITNRPIRIAASKNSGALGSAVLASLAAGSERGGYDRIEDATRVMANLTDIEYRPNPQHVKLYDQLYKNYVELHDYFGRGQSNVMKDLKRIQKESILKKAEWNLTEHLAM